MSSSNSSNHGGSENQNSKPKSKSKSKSKLTSHWYSNLLHSSSPSRRNSTSSSSPDSSSSTASVTSISPTNHPSSQPQATRKESEITSDGSIASKKNSNQEGSSVADPDGNMQVQVDENIKQWRHSVMGIIKSIGDGIHSLPSRYNHNRNASETFKQMRAREGEGEGEDEGQGQDAGPGPGRDEVVEAQNGNGAGDAESQPITLEFKEKEIGKEKENPTEESAQKQKNRNEQEKLQEPRSSSSLTEPQLLPPSTSTLNMNTTPLDNLSPPQMDSSASLRRVPFTSNSDVISQSAGSQANSAFKPSSSQQSIERSAATDSTPRSNSTQKAKQSATSSKDSSQVSATEATKPSPPNSSQSSLNESITAKNELPSNNIESPSAPSPVEVPQTLEMGEVMLKVTPKKVMKRVFRIDADRGQILWDSKKKNKVDLESIREVRVGSSASSYRISLSISSAHEPRWLSIIYQTSGRYKALHLIALTDSSLLKWKETLSLLHCLRRSLMGGLGSIEQRQEIWLKSHWKETDCDGDEKLDFEEMSLLCKRLGIESSRKELFSRFKEADERNRGFLDFKDFQRFVKLLKKRVELEEIFERLFDVWVEIEVGVGGEGKDKIVKDGNGIQSQSQNEKNGSRVEDDESKMNEESNQKSRSERIDQLPPPSSSSTIKVRGITASRFRRFLHEEQMMSSFTSIEVSKVFEKHHTPSTSILSMHREKISNPSDDTEGLATGSALLLDGFSSFLMSADNSILLDQSPLIMNQKQIGKEKKIFDSKLEKISSSSSPSSFSTSTSLRKGLISAGKLEDPIVDSKSSTNVVSNNVNPKLRSAAQTTEELLAASVPRQSPIHHDMTRPLSEYFISSSHNTYLVGGQWKGDSTVEGYIRALQQGARSVELDCWDGPNSTPQITHGRTLTSKVPFIDVISAISKYAFISSPYPLILSLEVHNDLIQQDVMAKILREKLGDMLLTEKIKGLDSTGGGGGGGDGSLDLLPSPEDLKGKVLIKTKNLYVAEEEKRKAERAELAADQAIVAEGQTTSTDTTESDGDGLFANARDLVRQVTKRSSHSSVSKESSNSNKVLMSADLASLLVYTIGVKHRGLNKKETYAVEHMISLSERSAFKYIRDKNSAEDLIKHNRNHLTRIYPSMSSFARLNSSANFNPHHIWAVGCQLVALNWQTLDSGFEINQAFFNRNGKSGYVLKPDALRLKEFGKNSSTEKIRLSIDIEIISAQQLPRFRDSSKEKEKEKDGEETDAIDPFVAVSIQTPEGWGPQPVSGEVVSSSSSSSSSPFGNAFMGSSSRDSLLGGTGTPVIGSPPGRVSAQNSPTTRQLRLPTGGNGSSLGLGSSPPISVPGSSASSSQTVDQINMSNPNLLTPPARSSSPIPNLSSSPPTTNSLRRNFSSSSLSSTSSRNSTQLNQRTSRLRTRAIKGNGFNPIWKHKVSIILEIPAGEKTKNLLDEMEKERIKSKSSNNPHHNYDSHDHEESSQSQGFVEEKSLDEIKFEQIHSLCRGLLDLCFIRFEVAEEENSKLEKESNGGNVNVGSSNTSSSGSSSEGSCIAACTLCLGSMQQGYRHVPLYDSQLSQYLFSTLFIHSKIRFVKLVDGTKNSSSKK